MKQCARCKTWKEDGEFSPDKKNKDRLCSHCKKCRAAATSKYNHTAIGRIRGFLSRKKYRASHREIINRKHAKWCSENKDKKRANNHKYYSQHKEKFARDQKVWRAAHPSKNKEYRKKHYATHKEQWKVSKGLRRARENNASGSFTGEQWIELCNRFGNRCLCCGSTSLELTVDHVIPISRGGTNGIDNIQPLCMTCNNRKNARHIDYRKQQ